MKQAPKTFVFDFDSTLVSVESFDELLAIALSRQEQKAALQKEIEAITDAGMNGEIDLSESLTKRLQLAQIAQTHITETIALLTNSITPGMEHVIAHLQQQSHQVCIMSGGFLEMILPVADLLAIPKELCFANDFLKSGGIVTGIDFANPLSRSSGKAETIARLKTETGTKIVCIGDGMSDAIPYLNGMADEFWGFFANKDRPKVREKATRSFDSTEELLSYIQNNNSM